jgi:hypothetical protein
MSARIQPSAIVLAIILLATQVLAYWYWFGIRLDMPLSEKPDSWGQFGDYIGGILNPMVALSALVWLMRSVELQEKELSETRKALSESARTQQAQLEVMRRDQQLASLSAILQAKTSRLTELGRIHNYYLTQLTRDGNQLNESGVPLRPSDFLTLLNQSAQALQRLNDEHAATARDLEVLIARGQK